MCEGEYGRTPLHFASQSGNLDVIKYFIDEQHIDPSCQDGNNDTPLHVAALSGQLVVVKYLITEKHCNPLCKGKASKTPLHNACAVEELSLYQYVTATYNLLTPAFVACSTSAGKGLVKLSHVQ